MRKIQPFLIFCLLLFVAQPIVAQTLQTMTHPPLHFSKKNYHGSANGLIQRTTAVACGPDTVGYAGFKATGISGLNVNSSTSAGAVGQYFDAPQPITVHGFSFYAWKGDATGGSSINVACKLFAAGPDSLPVGNALANVNVAVDTNFYGGTLALLRKTCTFNTPIVMSVPYVIVVANASANPIAMAIDDYQATPPDGLQEWLGMGQLGPNWLHGYELVLGAFPFDADILMEPLVSYSLTADFAASPSCLTTPGTVNFTNLSSPVYKNRMYNVLEALHLGGSGVFWNFGDGSPIVEGVVQYDTSHAYATASNFTIAMVDTMVGWTSICAADTFKMLGGAPTPIFSTSLVGLNASFTDLTGSTGATYAWDFGDGGTSTLQNPSHIYATLGAYQVCETVTDACGTGTTCNTVQIGPVGLNNGMGGASFTIYPNPNAGNALISFRLNEIKPVSLTIYNAMGAAVRKLDLGELQQGEIALPIADLVAGCYWIQMETSKGNLSKRMQIMR